MEVLSKIDSLLSKIESKADIIGAIYGILADPIADGRGLAGAIPAMISWLSEMKPEGVAKYFEHLAWAIQNPHKYPIVPGLTAFIGGWLAKELAGDMHPLINRLGSLAEKLGLGLTVGGLIAVLLWLSRFNPSPEAHGASHGTTGTYYIYK